MKKILETTRLILHEFTLNDAEFILQLLNSPCWLQYIGDRQVHHVTDAEAYLSDNIIKSYDEHGFGFWRVSLKADGTVIGTCGLAKRDYLDAPDIGYALLPEYERKGYAFEAAAAVQQYAKTVLGLKRLLATVVPDNERSIKLLTKLGLSFEKEIILPNAVKSQVFGMVADEF
ncbi:GNAT family N-acetyltransferase [Mucilaginibacter koreensis]